MAIGGSIWSGPAQYQPNDPFGNYGSMPTGGFMGGAPIAPSNTDPSKGYGTGSSGAPSGGDVGAGGGFSNPFTPPASPSFTNLGNGFYQSGGNYYLPKSVFDSASDPNNPNNQDFNPFSITRSFDDQGNVQYGDIRYTQPDSSGGARTGTNYFINPSSLGITNPGENWMSQVQYTTDPTTGQQYANLGASPFSAINSYGPTTNFGGIENIGSSVAPAIAGGLLGAGVLGVTGAQAAGNAALNRPIGENLGNAALLDAAGAAATGGAALAGGGSAAPGVEAAGESPTLLAGPAVDSSAATDAAFGAGGPTAIAEPAGAGAVGAGGAGVAGAGSGLAPIAGTGGAAAGGAAAGGSILSRLTGADPNLLALGGALAGTGLGIAGANQQANASNALANRLFDAGQASRDRFNASMTPGFDPNTIPGYSGALQDASNAILRGLSTQGNPFGNPGGLIAANEAILRNTALPAIQQYQNANAQAGGFGALAAGAPQAGANAVGAQGGVFNAIGSGIANLTNTNPSLNDILANLGIGRGGMSAA